MVFCILLGIRNAQALQNLSCHTFHRSVQNSKRFNLLYLMHPNPSLLIRIIWVLTPVETNFFFSPLYVGIQNGRHENDVCIFLTFGKKKIKNNGGLVVQWLATWTANSKVWGSTLALNEFLVRYVSVFPTYMEKRKYVC